MMHAQDLQSVFALSKHVHPGYPEALSVFNEKLALFGMGCFVLSDGDLGVAGYCFSHPWCQGAAPPLNALLGAIPAHPDAYFIHDIALADPARRLGHPGRLLRVIFDLCRLLRIPTVTLVSVSGTQRFWVKHGFQPTADAGLQGKVKDAYAADAVHMHRPVEGFFA
jgi:GNAT superfamily N-acetyltransferase